MKTKQVVLSAIEDAIGTHKNNENNIMIQEWNGCE